MVEEDDEAIDRSRPELLYGRRVVVSDCQPPAPSKRRHAGDGENRKQGVLAPNTMGDTGRENCRRAAKWPWVIKCVGPFPLLWTFSRTALQEGAEHSLAGGTQLSIQCPNSVELR